MATKADVEYDIPVYGYEYVDEKEECNPCCGCDTSIDIHDETNLFGWGDYLPLPVEKKYNYEMKDVLKALNNVYGKDTLKHNSMDHHDKSPYPVYTLN